jgi:cytoplasmic iron level regulating protein YaaA (DUF328/UPF0246 family)
MLVIVSPAKKLDFETECTLDESGTPELLDKAKHLVKNLKKLDANDISNLMKISPKLGQLNYSRFQSFKTPFNKGNAKQSIMAFKGDTYVGLDAESFSKKELKLAQDKLRILSGLYGVLRPFDLIQPYRLEMGTRFSVDGKKDLYEYWNNDVTQILNSDLKSKKAKFLVNCASNEYSNVVDFNSINVDVVHPVFKEKKGDDYKIISIFAKRARGLMSRYIIKNNVKTYEKLLDFNLDGYKLNKKLSTDLKPVFTRG